MGDDRRIVRCKYFATRDAAWDFMRECDERGWSAGYPTRLIYAPEVTYQVQYIDAAPSLVGATGVL